MGHSLGSCVGASLGQQIAMNLNRLRPRLNCFFLVKRIRARPFLAGVAEYKRLRGASYTKRYKGVSPVPSPRAISPSTGWQSYRILNALTTTLHRS